MRSDRMEYRRLPGAGIDVSAVSIGTLGFMRGSCSPETTAEMVNRALDLGVNFIDAAFAYGRGAVEQSLGPVLERRRDEVYVLTRGHFREPEAFKEALDGSFERLRTDYIDIFQLHDVTNKETYEQVMSNGIYDMVAEKVSSGVIGCVGISTHGPRQLMQRMVESGKFKVITVAYNLTGTKRSHGDGEKVSTTAEHIMPLAREHGVGVTVMKPFGGGTILQEAPDGTRLTAADCIGYVLSNPLVSTVSPGVNDMRQLQEAVASWSVDTSLSKAELAALEDKGRRWGEHFCRRCGYCLPCVKEIPIPAVMQLYEAIRDADSKTVERMADRYAKLAVAPTACSECGVCEERCPYSLPIVDRMQAVASAFSA